MASCGRRVSCGASVSFGLPPPPGLRLPGLGLLGGGVSGVGAMVLGAKLLTFDEKEARRLSLSWHVLS